MNHDELYKALCKVPNGKEKSRDKNNYRIIYAI